MGGLGTPKKYRNCLGPVGSQFRQDADSGIINLNAGHLNSIPKHCPKERIHNAEDRQSLRPDSSALQ